MKNRVVLILAYFGKFPNYFHLFLQSCYNNPNVDFIFFTDNNYQSQHNVTFVHYQWAEFVNFIQTKFDFNIRLDNPYKLCDFKPAYGYIFEDIIQNYEYWGYCDCDLIFGDLSLLNPYLEEKHERIGVWAHLMIYKNNYDVNRWFINLHDYKVPSFQEIIQNPQCQFFDEYKGMDILVNANKKDWCKVWLFDDIIFYSKYFFSKRKYKHYILNHKTPMYFIYNRGKLFRKVLIKRKWETDESLYIHLQKRKMAISTKDNNNYYIIPNRFVGIKLEESLVQKKLTKIIVDYKYYYYILKALIKKYWSIFTTEWRN